MYIERCVCETIPINEDLAHISQTQVITATLPDSVSINLFFFFLLIVVGHILTGNVFRMYVIFKYERAEICKRWLELF